MASTPVSIGFIGLGLMGSPMSKNMAKKLPAGSSVHIFDVTEAPMNELKDMFPDIVVKCESCKEVAQKADIIFTMLPEGVHVKTVYLHEAHGIVAGLSNPKLLIDCSTIDTATNLHIKEQLSTLAPQVEFYDAPVSGGVIGAVEGTIAFFFGCSQTDPNIDRLKPLLETMGAKIIPCGGPSLGLAAKLSNNYLSGIIAIACSEAMDMGMRAGIQPDTLAAVFGAGTAQNTICDKFCPVPGVAPKAPSNNGYKGGFRVQLMRKDFGLAMDMARRVGAKNVLGSSGFGIFSMASEAPDCKDLDARVVFRFLGGNENWKK